MSNSEMSVQLNMTLQDLTSWPALREAVTLGEIAFSLEFIQ